ncbi:MAG: hypothetical protein HOQ24_12845 [Mycobacteriaceae bacterium]|nr:hypothetical protein [Mycobacteriaceae bacterium]
MPEFGYTAWGMDWVRLAEPLRVTRPEPLLPRARSIARSLAVQAVVEGRCVRASIHRGSQASVTHLEFEPMTGQAAAAIAAVIGPDPSVLTDDDHRALVAAGASPAPTLVAADCSCPARKSRCLHVLATLYDLARRVDETPHLALALQSFGAPRATAGSAPRWIPLTTLDPAAYFTVPRM